MPLTIDWLRIGEDKLIKINKYVSFYIFIGHVISDNACLDHGLGFKLAKGSFAIRSSARRTLSFTLCAAAFIAIFNNIHIIYKYNNT